MVSARASPAVRCSRARSRSAPVLARGTTSAGVRRVPDRRTAGRRSPPEPRCRHARPRAPRGRWSIQSATTSGRPFASTTTKGMPVPCDRADQVGLTARQAQVAARRGLARERRGLADAHDDHVALQRRRRDGIDIVGASPKNETPSETTARRRRARARSASAKLVARRCERLRPRAQMIGRGRRRGRSAARAPAYGAAVCRRSAAARPSGRPRSGPAARAPSRRRDALRTRRRTAGRKAERLLSAAVRAARHRRVAARIEGCGIQADRGGVPPISMSSPASYAARTASSRVSAHAVRQQVRHALGVADDGTLEPPLGLEHVGQQGAVHVHRHAGRLC